MSNMEPRVGYCAENLSRIAQNIIFYRKKRIYTQEELAEIAGVSKGLISQIEGGITTPSLKTLLSIAFALEITLSTLLEGEESNE